MSAHRESSVPRLVPRGRSFALGLLAGLAVVLGCGALGAPEFTGNRTNDGIAPYRDLGPLTLCLGERRLVGGTGDPAGFCIAKTTLGATCRLDSDCRSREQCVCGTCTVAFCASDSDCASGFACNQDSGGCEKVCDGVTKLCADGEVCSGGRCVAPCTAGSEEVCQTGEVCSRTRSRCVVARCKGADDPSCARTERCALQHEPRTIEEPFAMAESDGSVTLYFQLSDPEDPSGATAIWRATSAAGDTAGQGFRVAPEMPVLAAEASWEGNRVGAPALLRKPDGGYLLLYAGGDGAGLGRADSSDGRSFTKLGDPVLVPSQPWEAGRVGSPALAPGSDDGSLLVLYQGGDGAGIGLAKGPLDPSAGGLDKRPDPILTPDQVTDPILWRDVDQVGGPFLLYDPQAEFGARYRLYFHAHGIESSSTGSTGMDGGAGMPLLIPANDSIGYAASLDGEIYSVLTFNPIFDRVSNFVQHLFERAPSVIRLEGSTGGRFLLYYSGADSSGLTSTGPGVAVSPPPDLPFPGRPAPAPEPVPSP